MTRTRFGDKRNIKEVLPEIGPVITLTTLSTLIGFGALVFSHNQSVSSMGFVIAVGVFSCLLFTFILLPALLGIMEKKK
ncbi:MMPL family transporter [Acidobacteriota bacterium]